MSKISIGIMGYGNIGRGVEMAIRQNPDMQPVSYTHLTLPTNREV